MSLGGDWDGGRCLSGLFDGIKDGFKMKIFVLEYLGDRWCREVSLNRRGE